MTVMIYAGNLFLFKSCDSTFFNVIFQYSVKYLEFILDCIVC